MTLFDQPNDIFIWSSYLVTAGILVVLGVISWRAKTKDQATLRKLEQLLKSTKEK